MITGLSLIYVCLIWTPYSTILVVISPGSLALNVCRPGRHDNRRAGVPELQPVI
jgi:hypothetical protein